MLDTCILASIDLWAVILRSLFPMKGRSKLFPLAESKYAISGEQIGAVVEKETSSWFSLWFDHRHVKRIPELMTEQIDFFKKVELKVWEFHSRLGSGS